MMIAIALWCLCGAIGHIAQAREMVTYFGTPVWRQWTTYLMFYPAMLAGPFMILMFEKFPERHPERRK